MSGKILIAFDESQSTQKTISFIAEHFTRDHDITLFHVVPDTAAVCGLNSPSLTPYFNAERDSFCRMEDQRKKIITDMVEDAKKSLQNSQFDAGRIEVKVQTQHKGIASDIIQEAKNGYDIVAMGRRASSGIKEFLMGSTTQKVLHALEGIPLIIID